MSESTVNVVTEFILAKEQFLASARALKPEVQAIIDSFNLQVPVGLKDNLSAPLNELKQQAETPIVIPVNVDTSAAKAEIAEVTAQANAAFQQMSTASVGMGGAGGGSFGAGGSGDDAGGGARGFNYNPSLGRIGTLLGMHAIYRGFQTVGNFQDAFQHNSDYEEESDPVMAQKDLIAEDKAAQEGIHNARWGSLGLSYLVEKAEVKLGIAKDQEEVTKQDEKNLRTIEKSEHDTERQKQQRDRAEIRLESDHERLETIDMNPLDRQEFRVNKDYDDAMRASQFTNDDTERAKQQQDATQLHERDLADIQYKKDLKSSDRDREMRIIQDQGAGDTYAARKEEMERKLAADMLAVRNENGDLGAEDKRGDAVRAAFDAIEKRKNDLEVNRGQDRINAMNEQATEIDLTGKGDHTGAERSRIQFQGDEAVNDLKAQYLDLEKLTKGTAEYTAQLNLRAEAEARAKLTTKELADFDATTARRQAQTVRDLKSDIAINNFRAAGDSGGASSLEFQKRQDDELHRYEDPKAGHTPAEIQLFKDKQDAEKADRKRAIDFQNINLQMQEFRNNAETSGDYGLIQQSKYEDVREHAIQEYNDADPANKDAARKEVMSELMKFKKEMMGGWTGPRVTRDPNATTEMLENAPTMSSGAYMHLSTEWSADLANLSHGGHLNSDFTSTAKNNTADGGVNHETMKQAAKEAIKEAMSDLGIQHVGVITY